MSRRPDAEIEHLRRVAGVLTPQPLATRFPEGAAGPSMVVEFAAPATVRGHGPLRGATVTASLVYRRSPDPPSAWSLRSYRYALHDRHGTELLAYHWHPVSPFPTPSFPHLHVSAALRPASADGSRGVVPLDKLHLPTGPVPLAAVARALVEEFGVEPRAADWAARLRPDPAPPG